METVKLIIDRKPVEVPKGTTILDAAKGMGIRIPTLCYMKLEDLHYENNPGACRICVVEIEGRRNLAPSCKTECMEGMVVQTQPCLPYTPFYSCLLYTSPSPRG